MSRTLRAYAGALAAVAFLASGCSIDDPTKAGDAPSARPSFSLPSPSPLLPRAPLTGAETDEATAAKTSVLVPIEVGTGAAAPVGLDLADLVGLDFAEGSLLRAVGVYQSQAATKVGPVAAVRPGDLKLFNQLRPFVAHDHTVAQGWLDTLKSTNLASGTPASRKAAFTTASGRTYANAASLQAPAPSAAALPAPLFQYAQRGESLSATGLEPAASVTVQVAGHAALTWRFDQTTRRWQTTVGGVPVAAANLVLLTVPYKQKAVNALHRTVSLPDPAGTGAVRVFGAGQSVTGTWSKVGGLDSALNLLGPAESLVRLATGPTWVLLLPAAAKVTVS
ncbi:hypothetical protein Cs7R123_37530 [Catellatospora sp. TT07R-123]|uniref:DUF3048 domain-containing protein n=1 Tax=Catellatospora sp. TT07R-123 TaxID=2733863 RepID=UPI001B0F99A9|nr:DUF3048 domain-containing protein [Catellatospora sp. TT07R-123]GHJ46411.1 hypothetical protein Cs7R123_37530 [Catellatospora sp. TT07R-123]